MLGNRLFDRARIDLTRTKPPGFNRGPAIPPLLLVFLEDVIPPVTAVKLPHRRVTPLNLLEVLEDRLPLRGQLHLRRQIHVDVEIVGNRRKWRHAAGSPLGTFRKPRAYRFIYRPVKEGDWLPRCFPPVASGALRWHTRFARTTEGSCISPRLAPLRPVGHHDEDQFRTRPDSRRAAHD